MSDIIILIILLPIAFMVVCLLGGLFVGGCMMILTVLYIPFYIIGEAIGIDMPW